MPMTPTAATRHTRTLMNDVCLQPLLRCKLLCGQHRGAAAHAATSLQHRQQENSTNVEVQHFITSTHNADGGVLQGCRSGAGGLGGGARRCMGSCCPSSTQTQRRPRKTPLLHDVGGGQGAVSQRRRGAGCHGGGAGRLDHPRRRAARQPAGAWPLSYVTGSCCLLAAASRLCRPPPMCMGALELLRLAHLRRQDYVDGIDTGNAKRAAFQEIALLYTILAAAATGCAAGAVPDAVLQPSIP